jgi:hypothetical protein
MDTEQLQRAYEKLKIDHEINTHSLIEAKAMIEAMETDFRKMFIRHQKLRKSLELIGSDFHCGGCSSYANKKLAEDDI